MHIYMYIYMYMYVHYIQSTYMDGHMEEHEKLLSIK